MRPIYLVLFFLSFCGFAQTAWAADPLVISVGAVEGASGQDVEIPISVKGAHNVGALQVRLAYDPALLEARSATRGPAAAQMEFVPTMGEGEVAMGLFGTTPMNNDGVVFKVLVHVRGATGQNAPLSLDTAGAWDLTTTAPLLLNTQNGNLTIVASLFSGRWQWIAGTGALVLLLLMVWLRRRSPAAKPARRRSAPPKEAAHVDEAAFAEEDLPTFGAPATFKHHCSDCQQVIDLPATALGKPFKCAGCGSVQVGGR